MSRIPSTPPDPPGDTEGSGSVLDYPLRTDPVMVPATERQAPRQADADGATRYDWRMTSRRQEDPVVLYVPPTRVVPVVFVPGIMGSNLKAIRDVMLEGGEGGERADIRVAKAGERVWNVDSTTSPLKADNSTRWLNASAAKRQLILHKDAVAVDDRGHIELHSNDLVVPLPVGNNSDRQRKQVLANRLADKRARGWGTISWYSYGPFLNWLEQTLAGATYREGRPSMGMQDLLRRVGRSPDGAETAPPVLTDAQVRKLAHFRFPVHAAGYNWLQSNMDSGAELAAQIRRIRQQYTAQGLSCEKVIVITHSMGGLVARAASQLHGGDQDILSVIHGVMPTDGAAAFYKRFVGGFDGEGEGVLGRVLGEIAARVLGPSARETTPVLGFGPGPMELAPNRHYNGGKPWLFITSANGKVLKQLPEHGDPYREIYQTDAWWQAINPEWLNPAKRETNALVEHRKALNRAAAYHEKLAHRFHQPTFAYYGNDAKKHKAWGTVAWRAVAASYVQLAAGSQDGMANPTVSNHAKWSENAQKPLQGDPALWRVLPGRTDVAANQALPERGLHDSSGQPVRCVVQPPTDPGDGTVPAAESAAGVRRGRPVVLCRAGGYDHQGSYNDAGVREFVLDSVLRSLDPLKVPA